jgi:hypothetical protein
MYLNNLLIHNFLPTLLLPTRVTKTSATVIDHVYYFEGGNIKKIYKLTTGNLYSDLSDHLPNFFMLSLAAKRENINNRPFIRLYTEKNKSSFHTGLSQINWQVMFYNNDDVNDCDDKFIVALKKLFESCFPLTRLSRLAFKDKKWITRGLKISSHHKDNLYKKWLVTKKDTDWVLGYTCLFTFSLAENITK